MFEEIYCDGIGDITVTGHIIRIDLVSLSPTERDANQQPKPVFRQRVTMPLDGFLQSFGMMEQVIQRLAEAGVVTKRSPTPTEAAAPVASQPRSPNFP